MTIPYLLVDTGYFFALFNPNDQYHDQAVEKREWLDLFPIAFPWPVLYETLNTKFVKNPVYVQKIDRIIRKPTTKIIDDSRYRQDAYETLLKNRYERKSLVDLILCALIEDVNVKIDALLTFNERDFKVFCHINGVEYL